MKQIFVMLLTIIVIAAAGCRQADTINNPPVKPKHTLALDVSFTGYANSNAGAILLAVPYNPLTQSIAENAIAADDQSVITNNQGSAVFTFEVGEENYWGFTIYKDTDGSGSLTTNDLVWGSGNNSFYYLYFPNFITENTVYPVGNWEQASTSGVHSS